MGDMAMRKVILGASLLAAATAFAARIELREPPLRWLWGGFGFHNAEASMAAMMSDEFRDERAVKTFLEIGPTYSRVFAGFSNWSKEEMDRFADYYDLTFGKIGTTLYVVPCRMPMITDDFDFDAYAEKVAANLEYMVKRRGCRRIAFYCATNETSVGPIYAWFTEGGHWAEYVKLNYALFKAFRRHELEIGLMTPDSSGVRHVKDIERAVRDLGEVTECYCWHLYDAKAKAGDLANYAGWTNVFSRVVGMVGGNPRRRISLGEFGIAGPYSPAAEQGCGGVMRDGRCYSERFPAEAPLAAITRAEMGLAAMNAGFVNAVLWTLADYPDPFLGYPGGESAREKAEHEAKDRAAFALDQNYNKWGLFRWCDDRRDYSARADLYTMGYLMKLFRRGARVLPWESDDSTLRVGAVTNPDGSCSIAVINWGEAKQVEIACPHRLAKKLRVYRYEAARVPQNDFNDLQDWTELIHQDEGGAIRVSLPAQSMTFLTSDYTDRVPTPVGDLRLDDGALVWTASPDAEHRYYRVFRNGRQIASTVATRFARGIGADARLDEFAVRSVDCWGNVGPCRSAAHEELVALQAAEIGHVVRPAWANGGDHWNVHSERFLYPPSLPFREVAGAVKYGFTVLDDANRRFDFSAARPDEPLTNVWPKLATGFTTVICRGLDAKGNVVGDAGSGLWWKAAPFRPGAYPPGRRSAAEGAAKIYDYVFGLPSTRYFLKNGRPDPAYSLNCYPAKIHSALIKAMVRYAKAVPERATDALALARTAADYLIFLSEKPGAPLAGFPPTYATGEGYVHNTAGRYAGQTMLLYPSNAGGAYITLFRATGERKYLDAAVAIAERYLALQGEDGTWPLKAYLKDGQPVTPNRCLPITIAEFLEDLHDLTHEAKYRDAATRAFAYVERGPLANWNWEGQFEDVPPSLRYRNLTKHPACETAIYMMRRWPNDARKVALARELLRFAEDQFVYWERPCHPDGRGIRTGDSRYDQGSSVQRYLTWLDFPSVTEQYSWNIPIDASNAKVIRAYLALYRATGNRLDLAKAQALGDTLTRVQLESGRIPTQMAEYNLRDPGQDWLNCMLAAAAALEELAEANAASAAEVPAK